MTAPAAREVERIFSGFARLSTGLPGLDTHEPSCQEFANLREAYLGLRLIDPRMTMALSNGFCHGEASAVRCRRKARTVALCLPGIDLFSEVIDNPRPAAVIRRPLFAHTPFGERR